MNASELPRLVLVRGLPGSGKTTTGKALELIGYKRFEADMWFERLGRFDAACLGAAHAWCRQAADAALSAGHHVVVCNTFTRLREMSDYILMASGMGVSLSIIEAEGDFGSVHDVPAEKLAAMRERWEKIPDMPVGELWRLFVRSAVR